MQMGVENILKREQELLNIALPGLREIVGIEILANNVDDRLGVISFQLGEMDHGLTAAIMSHKLRFWVLDNSTFAYIPINRAGVRIERKVGRSELRR